jgi:hypothetical protein
LGTGVSLRIILQDYAAWGKNYYCMSDTQACTCTCTEKHGGHMCVLKSKGLLQEVAALQTNPTVVCFICGEEANSAESVCSPMPLDQ